MSNLRMYRGTQYEVNFQVVGNLLDLGGNLLFKKSEAHEIGVQALRFMEYCCSAIDDIHQKGVKNWEIRDLELLSDFTDDLVRGNINMRGCQTQLIAVKARNEKLIVEIELYNKQLHALNLLRNVDYPSDFNDIKMNHFGN